MKLKGRCATCKKVKWFIRKRTYNHKHLGKMTSKGLLCTKCYKGILKVTQ